MDKVQETLNDFIWEKSLFFELRDGAEAEVLFLGAEKVITSFNGSEVQSIRYYFEVNGRKLSWDRMSRSFAVQMRKFSTGDKLWIKRTGERNKTKYEVEKIN